MRMRKYTVIEVLIGGIDEEVSPHGGTERSHLESVVESGRW